MTSARISRAHPPSSKALTAYLTAYNLAQFLGWSWILVSTIRCKLLGGDNNYLWQVIQLPLLLFQTAAILEVLHCLLGFVRAPVVTTAMQVASRIWVLWGIVYIVPWDTTTGSLRSLGGLSPTFASLVIAWALSEIIRYGFFAARALNIGSHSLLWLRYSGFLALYPIGVSSELTMVWLALPYIRSKGLLSLTLPNRINFGFDYYLFCVLGMLVYIPGFPHMFYHMLRQRNKNLSAAATGSKKRQ